MVFDEFSGRCIALRSCDFEAQDRKAMWQPVFAQVEGFPVQQRRVIRGGLQRKVTGTPCSIAGLSSRRTSNTSGRAAG
jgi:hypothetical protein